MPKFRYSVLANDVTKTSTLTSGVETIDLPEKGLLTEVAIQTRSKPSYSSNTTLPHYLAIQKLELLVNGSTVVKSLTGRQARALQWYRGGPFASSCTYAAAANHNVYYNLFPLYLGTSADDTRHALRLEDYANPQLKITWDVSQTSVDGITYDANTTDPSFTYNVMAKVIDGTPANFTNRYVQSREIDNWTVAASTEHATEIPRGYPLFGLMLGCRYLDVGWAEFFDKVKLDFDNGKWVPIDMDYENLRAAFQTWFPKEVKVNVWHDNANADNLDTQVMFVNSFTSSPASTTVGAVQFDSQWEPVGDISMVDWAGAAITTKKAWHMQVRGWGPMQTIYIPMSALLDGEANTINTTDYGRIDLKVTTGSGSGSSAVTRVVAEYLKPNGE